MAAESRTQLEQAARFLRATSEPTRLELLLELRQGEQSVTELSRGRSFSAVSQRLRVLQTAGLVDKRRDGKRQLYSLRSPEVEELLVSILHHASALSPS